MRASEVETAMGIAETMAKRGTCDRLQVGAIIMRDNRVISTGYNGNVSGAEHCDHRWDHLDLQEQGCRTAVHAEANAIVFAARHGVAVEGSDLWSTHQPCLGCANLIINAGIKRVFFRNSYRLVEGLLALQRNQVEVFQVAEDHSVVSMTR
jgi:dCMP deaminase